MNFVTWSHKILTHGENRDEGEIETLHIGPLFFLLNDHSCTQAVEEDKREDDYGWEADELHAVQDLLRNDLVSDYYDYLITYNVFQRLNDFLITYYVF